MAADMPSSNNLLRIPWQGCLVWSQNILFAENHHCDIAIVHVLKHLLVILGLK